MKWLLGLSLYCLNTNAASIYLLPKVNFSKRVVTLSILPNNQENIFIASCALRLSQRLITDLQVNLQLSPPKAIQVFERSFPLPAPIKRIDDLERLKLDCAQPAIKIATWILHD
jgi:hypothetical protein